MWFYLLQPVENALLDGASLPVQTIIFENTNFKAVPVDNAIKPKYTTNIVPKDQRPDKPRGTILYHLIFILSKRCTFTL